MIVDLVMASLILGYVMRLLTSVVWWFACNKPTTGVRELWTRKVSLLVDLLTCAALSAGKCYIASIDHAARIAHLASCQG